VLHGNKRFGGCLLFCGVLGGSPYQDQDPRFTVLVALGKKYFEGALVAL
jgi:hypothetical protein